MKKAIPRLILAGSMCLSLGSVAEAQIVRHIIGHAIAGKAVRSILGKDGSEPARDAGADATAPAAPAPAAPEGGDAADGEAQTAPRQ